MAPETTYTSSTPGTRFADSGFTHCRAGRGGPTYCGRRPDGIAPGSLVVKDWGCLYGNAVGTGTEDKPTHRINTIPATTSAARTSTITPQSSTFERPPGCVMSRSSERRRTCMLSSSLSMAASRSIAVA